MCCCLCSNYTQQNASREDSKFICLICVIIFSLISVLLHSAKVLLLLPCDVLELEVLGQSVSSMTKLL